MRFITEFEFPSNPMEHEAAREHRIGNIKSAQERHLGWVIAKSFGWDVKGVTTLAKTDPVKERFMLEIEAFPMDKWIEFKNKLIEHIGANPGDQIGALQLIKDLEFGK